VNESSTNFASVGATAVQIIPADPRRMALVFFAAVAQRYTISERPSPVLDSGITINSNSSPVVLRYDDVGNVIRKPWFAVASGAGTNVAWIEVTGP